MQNSALIVGGGLAGLLLARLLQERSALRAIVLEKSRGVGGRMATRRTPAAKFDHGAQFYARKDPLLALDERWLEAGLVDVWYEKNQIQRLTCPSGMTALAKNLAEGLDVRLERRVMRLAPIAGGWSVELDDGERMAGATLSLTCPLPQALELLRASRIAFDPRLEAVAYAKALVALIEGAGQPAWAESPRGHAENVAPSIASIADQKAKGVSALPAWTVAMTSSFSDRHFDEPDDVILQSILGELRRLDPKFAPDRAELKKWRYSHPLSTFPEPFATPAPGLYLAGDAFGGPSLNGAAFSARALASELSLRELL